MSKRSKRIGSMLLAAVLVVVVFAGCGVRRDAGEEQARFAQFVQEEFRSQVETGSFSERKQILEHPENYGINADAMPVELFDTSQDVETLWAQKREKVPEAWQVLRGFDRNLLTEDQQEIYGMMETRLRQVETEIQDEFQYMENLWTVNGGIHTEIPMVFTNMRIEDETDIQDMLELMGTMPEAFAWYMDYSREQETQGYLQIMFDEVLEYCGRQAEAGLENSTYLTLRNKIAALGLDAGLTEAYQTQLKETFQTAYLGTYKKTAEELAALQKDGETHIGGLAQLQNGREYYEQVVLPNHTGNGRTAQETIALLEKWMDRSLDQIAQITAGSPELLESVRKIETSYTNYQEIMADLEEGYRADFPPIQTVSYEICEMPEEQRQNAIEAYYMLSAIDASVPDQIWVNPIRGLHTVGVYATMAHEGVPGHMYQYNYMKEHKGVWNLLQFLSYPGYTEGYGRYVEMVCLDYLDAIPEEEKALYRAMSTLENILQARMDVGIHYEGWTQNKMREYLQRKGLNPAAADAYMTLLYLSPGSIASYGVGLAEFLELREYAENELGDSFTKLGFHEAILKSGSAPFSMVRENVKEYVAQVKTGRSTASR